MSISGVSSLSLGGSQYDFTNMTSNQELSAAGQLFADGKITSQENATLIGLAVDYAPAPGGSLGKSEALNSTVPQNFMQEVQNQILELKGSGDPAEQKTLESLQSTLQVLNQYQEQSGISISKKDTETTLNVQA